MDGIEAKLLGFAKPSSVASKNHEATLLGFAMPDSVASRCRTVWLREAKQFGFAKPSSAASRTGALRQHSYTTTTTTTTSTNYSRFGVKKDIILLRLLLASLLHYICNKIYKNYYHSFHYLVSDMEQPLATSTEQPHTTIQSHTLPSPPHPTVSVISPPCLIVSRGYIRRNDSPLIVS